MNKGVANFYWYRQVAQAANGRYLDALSTVEDPTPAYRQVECLGEPQRVHERSYAGFNPARRERVQLLRALRDGRHLLHGFRNADIRISLYGDAKDRAVRNRQRAALGRLFKRLHVRGLLAAGQTSPHPALACHTERSPDPRRCRATLLPWTPSSGIE